MFFWNSLAFLMIQWMLAIWPLVPLPFLKPAWTLEVHGSHIAEAWLGEFWALLCYHVRWVQLCGSLSILWHCLSLGLEWKLTFSSPTAPVLRSYPSAPPSWKINKFNRSLSNFIFTYAGIYFFKCKIKASTLNFFFLEKVTLK